MNDHNNEKKKDSLIPAAFVSGGRRKDAWYLVRKRTVLFGSAVVFRVPFPAITCDEIVVNPHPISLILPWLQGGRGIFPGKRVSGCLSAAEFWCPEAFWQLTEWVRTILNQDVAIETQWSKRKRKRMDPHFSDLLGCCMHELFSVARWSCLCSSTSEHWSTWSGFASPDYRALVPQTI